MTRRARWIGAGALAQPSLQARCAGLAEAQPATAEPIVVWGAAPAPLTLSADICVNEGELLFVMIVPVRLAPGRARRWVPWCLAPAIATCRSFGVQAYLEGQGLWVAGRKVAGAGCAMIGACAVIAASLPRVPAADRLVESRFRSAVEAQFGWQFETSWPSVLERRAMAEVE